MADRSVCTPLLAKSDAQINTTSSPHAASVTDADKVINTKIDNTQVEGHQIEAELLKGLITDDYCHVCEAVLLFESQRQSHYEGKKHAQKLKVFLQSKRAERTKTECFGPQQQQQQQRTMTTDKDHFCDLCNMVFSSHIVAKSHYMGKVHSKNLRKQGFQAPVMDRHAKMQNPVLSVDPESTDQKSSPQSSLDKAPDLKATRCTPSTEVDLKDPNKHCVLCAATFNNPQMAFQHYNGRKHQRNQTRQNLLKELGDAVKHVKSFLCHLCGMEFNSVEMYQAHMQGNKHQTREKKVMDLCKSQHKAYNTFADELSDYIQIQKARGITQRPAVPNPSDIKKEAEEYEEEEIVSNNDSVAEASNPVPNSPPKSVLPHHSRVSCYNTAERWRPPHRGRHRLTRGFGFNYPSPVRPQSVSAMFPSQPVKRKRPRKQSSSSSDVTSSSSSSYSSSYSSSTSDNDDDPENSHREKRIKESRKDRDRRTSLKDLNKEKRRKRQRREVDKESKEQRREESEESEGERGKKRKSHSKRRRQDKKSQAEDCEAEAAEAIMGTVKTEHVMEDRKESEQDIHAEVKVEEGDDGQDDSTKPKNRKEKKKPKKKVDTRTEEEKLWDDSILGF
ncbi:uncharacterized protein V6R79_003058 [Siganus canaliculatus]